MKTVSYPLILWSDDMNSNDLNVKKQIMFIKDEDYYFLTYNILIILDYFKCYSVENLFKDYRKLPYLIEFLSSDKSVEIYEKVFETEGKTISIFDYEHLLKVYTKSKFMQGQIKRLLFSLDQNQLISIVKDTRFGSVSLLIKDKEKVKEILNDEMFRNEYQRIEKIKRAYSRLRSIKYTTFIEKVFKANGVGKWDD